MQPLTPEGQRLIDDLARQYQVSTEAVMSMLQAVLNGNGTMAQFNHPEFGGAGQWMQGGMTMVSDMFNHQLKIQVESLCSALANLLSSHASELTPPTQFQSQQQGGPLPSPGYGPSGPVSLFVAPEPGRAGHWWPDDLGMPSSTGAQNHVRYAYFAQERRLAIEVNGQVTVYDTLDHQIGGFSQQQSAGSSLSFSSQYGLIDVAQLPVITPVVATESLNAVPPPAPEATMAPAPEAAMAPAPEVTTAPAGGAQPIAQDMDIFTAIERLGELKARGLLTEEEFTNKKADLLSRL
ncbi:MAG: hypothetical protein ETSY1_43905 [Candidatus Entotheonella factor]|uniref:SHOCT domain-containing protein n=1 Tax=Entotheonella factor TaxID=1429438 RepID=W4L2R9_ENTF1|nr:SHOCT domain-containing protein [Candidatus Entotheonella palauensis]ETW92378.1 MAG: hypothetical protein ETSY1_43905 [Candidatus Entotheonella factor]